MIEVALLLTLAQFPIPGGTGSGGGGGGGGGVTSFNTLTGAVTISAGSGVTLTPAGNDIEIAASGSGGTFANQAECEAGVSTTTYANPACLSYYFSFIFPSQASNVGKYLTTDGSSLSWGGPILKNYVAARIQNTIATAGFSTGDCSGTTCPTATAVSGTNRQYATLDFGDSADQYAYDEFQLPDTNLPAISVSFNASTSTTSTAAILPGIATACIDGTGGDPDPSWNTVQTVSITPTGTAGQPVRGNIALSLTGCTAGDLLVFRITRDRTDANTATMQLHMVTFYVPN